MIDHYAPTGEDLCVTYGMPDDYQNSGSNSFRRLDYFSGAAAVRDGQLTSTPLFPIDQGAARDMASGLRKARREKCVICDRNR